MNRSFQARLINDPFSDPGLFVTFLFQRRAFLFDLGELQALSSRDLLKVSHVFVSHTHVDHFIGFDQLLRILLGRQKDLYLFGPQGFIQNVEGKLAGYAWNLIRDYENLFSLHVTEVHPEFHITRHYRSYESFHPVEPETKQPFKGVLIEEPTLSVFANILD